MLISLIIDLNPRKQVINSPNSKTLNSREHYIILNIQYSIKKQISILIHSNSTLILTNSPQCQIMIYNLYLLINRYQILEFHNTLITTCVLITIKNRLIRNLCKLIEYYSIYCLCLYVCYWLWNIIDIMFVVFSLIYGKLFWSFIQRLQCNWN